MIRCYCSILLMLLVTLTILGCSEADPRLEVTPSEIDFGLEDTSGYFYIRNIGVTDGIFKTGVEKLTYEIEVTDDWITVKPDSGECNEEVDSIHATINRTYLEVGTNLGSIDVTSNGGSYTINVIGEVQGIAITNPVEGSRVVIEDTETITWEATPGVSDSVNINLYLNDVLQEDLATNYHFREDDSTSGEFAWVPESSLEIGNGYRLKITDSNNSVTSATSAIFRISLPLISITRPDAGDVIVIGEDLPIEWEATRGVGNYVNISLYYNNSFEKNITSNFHYRSNDIDNGRYVWTNSVGLVPDRGYSIRVQDASNDHIFDETTSLSFNRPHEWEPVTEFHFQNIQPAHQVPSTVQFIFSLRDQNNHAVMLDPNDINWNAVQIWENNEEIDYLESHAFLYTAANFEMDIVLVMDFSASMREQESDFHTMIQGAHSLINQMGQTHRIGVIEFHRPEEAPAILQPLTTNKQAAIRAIDNFVSGSFYSDFSICWDAVNTGLDQFSDNPDPNDIRTLVFLSDGFDNSSIHQPIDLIFLAHNRDVHIYNIGVGQVHREDVLENISTQTGGTYVHAENLDVLEDRFGQIITDLGGQYKVSYITPKEPADGIFSVRTSVTYQNLTSSPPLDENVDPSLIYGETIKGIMSFSAPSRIQNQEAEVFLWGEHIPRYIHDFRFHLDSGRPIEVTLTADENGGLCEGWSITQDENNWYTLTSPDPSDQNQDLEFGDFGTICKITIRDITEPGITIPFTLDNSVYELGQSFYGGDDEEIDEDGNWVVEIGVGRR
ncbi:MAG: VWA domain-containing protein [Calditrichaeota bacterium]|nr:VWA domain-containing protein [Calditrichota bacterium]